MNIQQHHQQHHQQQQPLLTNLASSDPSALPTATTGVYFSATPPPSNAQPPNIYNTSSNSGPLPQMAIKQQQLQQFANQNNDANQQFHSPNSLKYYMSPGRFLFFFECI